MKRLCLSILFLLIASVCALGAVLWFANTPRQLASFLERKAPGASGWLVTRLILQDRGAKVSTIDYPAWTGARETREPVAVTAVRERTAASMDELHSLLESAAAGDIITLAPGRYALDKSLQLTATGRPDAPIVLRASRLGEVIIESQATEAFHVRGANWIFENLVIRGVCIKDADCEHAFHVTGAARAITIVNNRIEDFNAQLKINGENGEFPDGGKILGNTLVNSHPRLVGQSVTPIDLVAASNWQIEGNLIADFIKAGGDSVSYGAFAKGAGKGNRFERNVVLCEHRLRGWPGQRVGLSLGGGGTEKEFCRDGQCAQEQSASILASNLIAQCSDVGIYLNRAAESKVQDNTALDTAGVDVRFDESSAVLQGNLVDGVLRSRDGGVMNDEGNLATARWLPFVGSHPLRNAFMNVSQLDLRWREGGPKREAESADEQADLCGQRVSRRVYGAFEDFSVCLKGGR